MFSIAAALAVAAAGLTFAAIRQNANLFYTPGIMAERGQPQAGREVKIGGFVKPDTLEYGDGADIYFQIYDNTSNEISVTFTGIVPDLFREGQGVVAIGKFDETGTFKARQLLAKHDENYQPRELEGTAPAS